MHDYLISISSDQRSYIEAELNRRVNNPYVGAIVRKYRNDMPIWVFCEAVPFGVFSDLVKFCAFRWKDGELEDTYYLLKYVRSVRNATAHGSCWINGITDTGPEIRPPATLVNTLSKTGIPRRLRTKWLHGAGMMQICVTIYLYSKIVTPGSCCSERTLELTSLLNRASTFDIPQENPAVAALGFVKRLTTATGLLL